MSDVTLIELSPTAAADAQEDGLPGATASGLGSAAQLVEVTAYVALRTDATAAPGGLRLARRANIPAMIPHVSPLTATEFPVLAGLWDNEADEVFDRI